ncbi:RelA/SpoT domain-containing protein [Photobacterium sp. GB-36]|uniref:RelA/SpoT domain-containing protein n=1 Tax=Photobacterium sp. GB-36 TaxID=2022108 RepID=UPI000D16D338|nr:RelA/SpoT domain-containing protein [Photobacterium sp. GB-36]PSV43030.1 hypothetical protein C9J46_12825 [Photobacterium sp. GB-36]
MSIADLTEASFLSANRISQQEWQASSVDWPTLHQIGLNHEANIEQLKETAEMYARIIQRCQYVHSVRWRVKDPQHLMEKIVRKTQANTPTFKQKYVGINPTNYDRIVTDLIGVRALHLFKEDCLPVHDYLCQEWKNAEPPIYYVRNGDDKVFTELPSDVEVKIHPAGYRSLHYVFGSQPLNHTVFTEVQVRTIFEEGWTEIDHKIRYPNFSHNEQVCEFLLMFNRLAGSADEMGSFVKQLVSELEQHQKSIDEITHKSDVNAQEVAELFKLLEQNESKQQGSQELIDKLREQVEQLQTEKNTLQKVTKHHVVNRIDLMGKAQCRAADLMK